MAITQECCVQSWTSPGCSNTPQDTNCTATCLLSRKLFKLGEPHMQDIAGEAEMNSKEMYSYGSPHMAAQKQDDQHERTFSSYVRIQVVVLKTCLGRWTIGRSGERGSGISMLPARYDDDDDEINCLTWNCFWYWNCTYAKVNCLILNGFDIYLCVKKRDWDCCGLGGMLSGRCRFSWVSIQAWTISRV